MEEWKKYKLGEITSKIGSGATPKGGRDSYLGGNIALIRSPVSYTHLTLPTT